MYFWRIEKLKQDLVAGAVSERSSLLYLLWFGGITTALYLIPLGQLNIWDHVDSAVIVLAFIVGTVYLYRCNLGPSGQDFLLRYISLGWVYSVRFTFLVGIPVIAAGLVAEALLYGEVPQDSTPFESAVLALLEVAYFIRLGHHFSAVSSTRVAA